MPKLAVLSLDFVNDIANSKGKVARAAERIFENQCIEKTNRITAWARKNAMIVIHVKLSFSPSYIECPSHSPVFAKAKEFQALLLGTWGTEFVDELQVENSDHILVKHRVSAFYNTNLETVLRAQHCDGLILTGTATNMAVEATARDAHDRDYFVTVIKDACESSDQDAQDSSLANLARFSRVLSIDEFLAEN